MVNEGLQGEEQFDSKNFGNASSRVKMRLKSAPQKLNFVIAKTLSKSYTLELLKTRQSECYILKERLKWR